MTDYLEAYRTFSDESMISPGQKIKVFISSICGVERYDKVRLELKKAIESTQLAEVYLFEGAGASTLSAGNHYTWALEDSDICIFLIDNADGIRPGVQAEIDTVNKYKIKALYYFCDETQKEKTALEQSLMGANFAKSKELLKLVARNREELDGTPKAWRSTHFQTPPPRHIRRRSGYRRCFLRCPHAPQAHRP